MHLYLHLLCRNIIHLTNLYLAPLISFKDGINHARRGSPVRNIPNNQRAVIKLFNGSPHFHRSSPFPVIIPFNINVPSRLEVRIKRKLLLLEVGNCRIADLVEIVGKDTGGETHRDTFGSLRQ